jgi:hypothetical protein
MEVVDEDEDVPVVVNDQTKTNVDSISNSTNMFYKNSSTSIFYNFDLWKIDLKISKYERKEI